MSEIISQPTYEFVDHKNRKWNVLITLAGARRVDTSDFTEIDPDPFTLMSPDEEIFKRLLTNSSLAFAVIWAIVQPQTKEVLGIDPKTDYDAAEEEFLDGMTGDVIVEGIDALWGALANFFPEFRIVLSVLIEEYRIGRKRIEEKMAALTDELRKEVRMRLEKDLDDGMRELLKTPE